MKKSILARLVSLILVLSVVLSVFTVFPVAEKSEEDEGVKIIYNRSYEEGWNYSNGMITDFQGEVDINISYKKISASWYNYYLRFAPNGDAGGYVAIPLDGSPSSGKLFFEMDFKASAENNIGGIVMFEGKGEGADKTLSHIVSMKDGSLYLLGERVDDVPDEWTTIKFEFDFDYASTAEDAESNEYLIKVVYGDGITAQRVYKAPGEFGVSKIHFGAQENLFGFDRDGDEYFVDNVKVYYGVNEFTELDENNYGTAIDMNRTPDLIVQGAGGSGSYLSGQPNFNRLPIGDESVIVHYNRYFSEGWDYDNGTQSNAERENDFSISTDYAADLNKGSSGFLNYYLQMVQRNTQNGFIRLVPTTAVPKTGTTFLEFDVKASVGASTGSLIEMITPGAKPTSFPLAALSRGNLVLFGQIIGPIGEEWCHVAVKMDFDYVPENGDETAIKFDVYVGANPVPYEFVRYIASGAANRKGIMNLRIGRSGSGNVGDWWGLDNLQLYTASDFAIIPDDNYGSLVNSTWTKDFAVNSGFAAPSVSEIVDSSLVMKTGSDRALLFGERVNLFTDAEGNAYGAPIKNEDGKVMLPLETILQYTSTPYEYHSSNLACDIFVNGEYTSIAVGRNTAEVKGETHKLAVTPIVKSFGENRLIYIGLEDVEALFNGYYVTYDDTGLFFIAEYDEFINRNDNEEFMHETAKRFLFVADTMVGENYYDLAKEYTNNFTHPYILTNQERFDMLHNTYYSAPGDELFDEELIWYIDTQIAYANTYLNKYAILDTDGNYIGLKEGQWKYNSQGMASWDTTQPSGNHPVSIMPYPESGGYDPAGGRLNVLSDGEGCLVAALEPCAIAFQITKDETYLQFAYEWMVALGQWEHWGPGHYLNCANTTRPYATAFDWLYNDLVRVYGQEKVDEIEEIIFKNGVYEAWITLPGAEGSGKVHMPPEHTRPNGGDASFYWRHIGNWNPCGTLGMLIGSLVVMKNPEYVETASFVIERSLFYYAENGMTYVTFDGGYRESAGYWGCVRFMHFIHKIMQDCFGTDLGFTTLPGIDTTDYFGPHIENSEYERWVFHDDWAGSQASYWYYLSAKLYNNPEYAAIRYLHIHSGNSTKAPFRYDLLFYDPELISDTSVDLGLDWIMTSIDATVSRSSWEPGALYCGIMGGGNNVAHGQYDSGNWIYDNAGINWFTDLGADDYNLYGGGLAGKYYKYSAEGNNTLSITSMPDSLPAGQLDTGWGQIVYTNVNEYGTATVIDNSYVYGGSGNVTYARRGMFLTNDRKTMIIQDEVNLVLVQDLFWCAHFNINEVNSYEISPDGRTVYLTSKALNGGERKTLRVTLVTANRGFKFSIRDCYDFALEGTPDPDYSKSMNGIAEGDRSKYRRLCIEANSVLKFEVAVVLEVIDPEHPIEEGYTLGWDGKSNALRPMMTWVPDADTRTGSGSGIGSSVEERPNPSLYHLLSGVNNLLECVAKGQYLTVDKEEFFKCLAANEYVLNRFGRDNQNSDDIIDAIIENDSYKAIYDKYEGRITDATVDAVSIAKSLTGISH